MAYIIKRAELLVPSEVRHRSNLRKAKRGSIGRTILDFCCEHSSSIAGCSEYRLHSTSALVYFGIFVLVYLF